MMNNFGRMVRIIICFAGQQIKRNCLFQFAPRHLGRRILCQLCLSLALSQTNSYAAINILQQTPHIASSIVRYSTHSAFVICRNCSSNMSACADIPAQYTCSKITLPFSFGSFEISPEVKKNLFIELSACAFSKSQSVIVTGHTCSIGNNKENIHLALSRAERVAELLRRSGFTVSLTQGFGSTQPLTQEPEEFYKNRRVEITPTLQQHVH